MNNLESKIQPSDSYGFTPANANNLQIRTNQTLELIKTLQEQEKELYKQFNTESDQLNQKPVSVQPSLAPGCYIKLSSGCPRQKNPGIASQAGTVGWPADKWAKDTWGEKNVNSGKNKSTCENQRLKDYNGWCGVSNAQAKFVSAQNVANPQVPKTNNIKPLINKINDLGKARKALFTNLQEIYADKRNNVLTSRDNLIQQYTTAQIVENQLNSVKKNIAGLQGDKYNQLRMVEINKYATDRFQAYSKFYLLILYFIIPMIILGIISKYNFISERFISKQNSNNIILVLMIINSGLALYFIVKKYLDISNRDNMNFNQINTGGVFDPKKYESVAAYNEKQIDLLDGKLSTNPYDLLGKFDADCIGSNCKKGKTTYSGYNCPKDYPYLRSLKDTNSWWCYKKDGAGCNIKSDIKAPNDGTWGFNNSFSQC